MNHADLSGLTSSPAIDYRNGGKIRPEDKSEENTLTHISVGDEVLTRKFGRRTITHISLPLGLGDFGDALVLRVPFSIAHAFIFDLDGKHWCEGCDIMPLPRTTEITPEQALHAMDSTSEDAE